MNKIKSIFFKKKSSTLTFKRIIKYTPSKKNAIKGGGRIRRPRKKFSGM
jgi:hypothetical protein